MKRWHFVLLLLAVAAAGYYASTRQGAEEFPVVAFADIPSTPEEVERLNADANFGYVPPSTDSERTLQKQILASLPGGNRTLREQAPELFEPGKGDATLLYRSLYLAYEQRYPGSKWAPYRQGIGDCVSMGWAVGCDTHLAVLWRLGYIAEWPGQVATESIYGGSRVEARGVSFGGWNDGSNGGSAAGWVSKTGGLIFRQKYDGFPFDLTKYSPQTAKQWGAYGNGGQGDKGQFDKVAKQHPIKRCALVTTWEETVAAIENGYPIPVCSGQGFSSRRDKDGFSAASGSWSHCMLGCAVRKDREGVLIQNSWGSSWISGPKWPDDQPDGSFWCERRTWERMIRGRDSFAVCGFEGGFRKLRNKEGWDGAMFDKVIRPTETDYALAP